MKKNFLFFAVILMAFSGPTLEAETHNTENLLVPDYVDVPFSGSTETSRSVNSHLLNIGSFDLDSELDETTKFIPENPNKGRINKNVSEDHYIAPTDHFITTWETTTANESITIPTTGGGYNYIVDWGDGSTDSGLTGNATHTYTVPGVYTVKVQGSFPRIYFNNSGDKSKIRSIEQWGTNVWTSMQRAFYGCANLTGNATDAPDLSQVTDMSYMFASASAFNQDIGSWNVGNVAIMTAMFYGATTFNQDIGSWNVGNVTNISSMFWGASAFNQNIGSWDVGNVTNMAYMFEHASAFNQDIGSWDVHNVTNMSYMFSDASSFNQDISTWCVTNILSKPSSFDSGTNSGWTTDKKPQWGSCPVFIYEDNSIYKATTEAVGGNFYKYNGEWFYVAIDRSDLKSKTDLWNNIAYSNPNISLSITGLNGAYVIPVNHIVTTRISDMNQLFFQKVNFKQNIGSWDVGNVTTMARMFQGASAFNQDIGSWNVGNVAIMTAMFYGATTFNQDIGSWNVGNVTNISSMFWSASAFNQNIGSWDVGNVTNMYAMFFYASAFNQDIGSWDVRNVANMSAMFESASTFDQNIGSWNVGNVTNMSYMFSDASSFNQDISTWCVTNIPSKPSSFDSNTNSAWTIDKKPQWGSCPVFIYEDNSIYKATTEAVGGNFYKYNGEWFYVAIDRADLKSKTDLWNNNAYSTDPDTALSITGLNGTYVVPVDHIVTTKVTDMNQLFYQKGNFNQNIGSWDVGNVTNMSAMFYYASAFNQDIGSWYVGNVTDMYAMFLYASAFDQNIGSWDVGNVTNMDFMFYDVSAFNQNIGNWDVGNVTNMSYMFRSASAFNQDIGSWNVGNVTDMSYMFYNASSFNQNIGNWDVGNVTNMSYMFRSAWVFNQDIGSWDVGNVTIMSYMFYSAQAFNQDIGSWDVGNVTNMSYMFSGASSFNQNLSTWCVTNIPSKPTSFDSNTNSAWTTDRKPQWGSCPVFIYVDNSIYKATSEAVGGNFYRYNGEWFYVAIDRNDLQSKTDLWNDSAYSTDPDTALPITGLNGTYVVPVNHIVTTRITDMYQLFFQKGNFNQDIGSWDVGNVTNMSYMFRSASAFNGDIGNWDVGNVTNMFFMFQNATAFNQDIGTWDVGNVTNMSYMLYGAAAFNKDIGSWEVGNVTTMSSMFDSANSFNQNIGNWDVGNVTNMSFMFNFAYAFNQDIGSWDVGNVTDMYGMFAYAPAFNQDIGSWEVGNVTNMSYMFRSASAFNGDIGNWDVGNVTNMYGMFYLASEFNQDIGSWDVGKVTDMSNMFYDASSFNQDIGSWDVGNVTNMSYMFWAATLSTANYDALLNGWSAQTLKNNVSFHGGNSTYCAGAAARANIISNFGWTIADGGLDCSDPCGDVTEYAAGSWSNGIPDTTKKAVFLTDYNTTLGSIDACGIEILPGVTVTVAEGTTIRAEYAIDIDGDLIFLSSDLGDGELATMGTNSSITGEAVVQRYMQDKRSYRMVSPAVTTTTSIHNNWQEGATNNSDNPALGFGTHITGSTSDQTNGFDGTATGNPSMFTVNAANQQFEAITNTNVNTLTAGSPYLMFVRGDRSVDLSDNLAHSGTVLRAKGTLTVGNQVQTFTAPTMPPGGTAFAMFGNPYQSNVDMNSVFAKSTNVNPAHYYIYDPSLGTHGAYVTVLLPGGTNTSSSGVNQYLQPGQGAQFATLAPGATSVVFDEADKAPGELTSTNRPLLANNMLTVQLYTTENFNNGGSIHDSFGIVFDGSYSNGITSADAVKPMNFYENLGIDNNGKYLSMEQREIPQPGEVFQMYSSGYLHSDYTLKLTVDGLEDNILYLDDSFTGTFVRLEAGDNSYGFSVDANDALSIATDRFSIRTEGRLGVNDHDPFAGIRLFPNPLKADIFYISAPQFNGEQLTVSITDLSGRRIFDRALECRDNSLTVPMGNGIASGVYMVTLEYEKRVHTYRLIKE